jgi:predicted AlkP superfamily pyrophosphatase or phosphodiesterase
VVSIDGLMPDTYLAPDQHQLAVPTLRMIAQRGARARWAEPVLPTVTYPNHTTIATGAEPSRHGIVSNRAYDPLEKNQSGWRWYSEDIKVSTLWQAVEESGKSAALMQWPVSVGARVRSIVPEYWRASTLEDRKLLRAMSTPGLLEAMPRRFPARWPEQVATELLDDERITDLAIHVLDTAPPDLMMIHFVAGDAMTHEHGMWSAQANAATELADKQLARIIEACRRRGIWDRTALFVVSDHGFAPNHTELRPAVLFRDKKLIEVNAAGKPVSWRAGVQANGGSAYIYLFDPGDQQAAAEVRAALAPFVGGKGPIKRIIEAEEIRRMGGDPAAFIALDGADGVGFQEGVKGTWVTTPAGARGHHGWAPDNPAMRASFLAYGAGIPRTDLGPVRLLDVGPTVAAWLGVVLPEASGKPIAGLQGRKITGAP